MQETLQALLSLQAIDRDIYRVESELKRLPQELARRQERLDEKMRAANERLEEVRQLKLQIKEIEDLTTGQRQRLRKLENEASKNKVDAAMLASYDHEIRTVKRTVGMAEDDGLKLVERSEALQAEADELQAANQGELTIFEQFKENVAKETAAAEGRLAELKSSRESLGSSSIPPEQLSLYRKILERREGEAMAELQELICQGCYVGIPKNLAVRLARGAELVQCPSCDRILFYRT
ncbi:MAG: hypothetical protein GY711_01030 [bacterium]|nr:hypothetical protein [bacterium]